MGECYEFDLVEWCVEVVDCCVVVLCEVVGYVFLFFFDVVGDCVIICLDLFGGVWFGWIGEYFFDYLYFYYFEVCVDVGLVILC